VRSSKAPRPQAWPALLPPGPGLALSERERQQAGPAGQRRARAPQVLRKRAVQAVQQEPQALPGPVPLATRQPSSA
jgi:hypothetical protein